MMEIWEYLHGLYDERSVIGWSCRRFVNVWTVRLLWQRNCHRWSCWRVVWEIWSWEIGMCAVRDWKEFLYQHYKGPWKVPVAVQCAALRDQSMVSHDWRAGDCFMFLIRDLGEICGHCFDLWEICGHCVLDLLEIYERSVDSVYCGRARRERLLSWHSVWSYRKIEIRCTDRVFYVIIWTLIMILE